MGQDLCTASLIRKYDNSNNNVHTGTLLLFNDRLEKLWACPINIAKYRRQPKVSVFDNVEMRLNNQPSFSIFLL